MDIKPRVIINYLKKDGFYKQTGNARAFVGPDGTKLTIFSPVSSSSRTWIPYGNVHTPRHDTRMTVNNNDVDEDMTVKDLKLMFSGIAEQNDLSLKCDNKFEVMDFRLNQREASIV